MKNSGGPLGSQTWQTEWKTAPLAEVQLYQYEDQTLEAFVSATICMQILILQCPARLFDFQLLCMIVKLAEESENHAKEVSGQFSNHNFSTESMNQPSFLRTLERSIIPITKFHASLKY